MESIDTSSKQPITQFYSPSYLLIEAEIPNVGTEFIPVRNFNPKLVPPKKKKKEDQKKDENDSEEEIDDASEGNANQQQIIQIKKSNKALDFTNIRRKDLFFHQKHGYLKVVQVDHEEEDDTKPVVSFNCRVLDNKGKKTDEAVSFTIDQARKCKLLSNKFQVTAKIHLPSGEALETQIHVPVKRKLFVKDVVLSLEEITNCQFNIFVDGQIANKKAKISSVINRNSKLLLITQSGADSRPEGIRQWFRFPKHNTTEESVCRSDEQSIVFVPIQDDIEFHGFMIYRHTNTSIDYMEVRMRVHIHDEEDRENVLFEKQFETIEVRYDQVQWDKNQIAQYNFVEKSGLEPIKIKAGQHFHLTHSYYHRSSTERFYYGEEGERFAEVENMDNDVFIIKPSRYYSSDSTTLEKGQMPGLLFKFSQD